MIRRRPAVRGLRHACGRTVAVRRPMWGHAVRPHGRAVGRSVRRPLRRSLWRHGTRHGVLHLRGRSPLLEKCRIDVWRRRPLRRTLRRRAPHRRWTPRAHVGALHVRGTLREALLHRRPAPVGAHRPGRRTLIGHPPRRHLTLRGTLELTVLIIDLWITASQYFTIGGLGGPCGGGPGLMGPIFGPGPLGLGPFHCGWP